MDPFHRVPYAASNYYIPIRMECRVWSRLPQKLMDRVIACLPPPAFFRARAVCKRWYALIFSDTFLELFLQVSSSHHHWFLFFKQPAITSSSTLTREREAYLFDPQNLKWYRLSFPLIPPGFSPASSSGGLICWASEDAAGSKTTLLCNPLIAGSNLIQLPPTPRPRLCPSIGLTITNTSIDLAFAGDDMISPYAVKNLTSESFHIDGGGFYSIWGTTATLPRLCSLESSGRMVHVEGRFYCMNYSPFSVLAYDISSNEWSKIEAPMRRFLRSPNLVESKGKLMLIAAVEKNKLNVPKSLRVWGLHDMMWVENERMPQQLYNEFAEIEGGRGFSCVGHGEFVVILIKGSDKSLLFDFNRKGWEWIPVCPYINHHVGDELHGFAYEPRLVVPITALLQQLTLPFNSFTA